MRKILAIILTLTLMLSLAACGGSEAAPTGTEAAAGQTEATEEESRPAEDEGPVIDRASSRDWDTEAEIAVIAPVSGIYAQSALAYTPVYEYLICRCITTEGGLVYLYLTVDDYLATFDADASVSSSQLAYSHMTVLEEPLRIQGKNVSAESLVPGLSETLGVRKVLHLGEVQPGSGTVAEAEYGADTPPLTCVKTDIVSIVPGYTLRIGSGAFNTDVICSAETANGWTVWVAMSVEDYQAYFDANAALAISGMSAFTPISLGQGVTLHGVALGADEVAAGLADAIGCATVFCFARKG